VAVRRAPLSEGVESHRFFVAVNSETGPNAYVGPRLGSRSEQYETVLLTPCLLSLVQEIKPMPLPEDVHRRLSARAVTDLDVASLLALVTKPDESMSDPRQDQVIENAETPKL